MYGELHWRTFAGIAILLALGVLLPLVLPEYFLYLGNTLMMYAILALGLDLLLGWSGQFAFAHIAFFGIGIYTSALLQIRLGVPFIVGVPIAAMFAGVVGLLIAIPATRLRTVYLALATYAFAECAQWVFRTWDSVTKGSDGLRISPPDIFGYVVGTDRRAFPVMAIILALVLLSLLYLTRSRLGRDLCAIRDSEHVASASGVDVKRTKMVAFVLSAVFAGLAGGTFTLFQSFINPELGRARPAHPGADHGGGRRLRLDCRRPRRRVADRVAPRDSARRAARPPGVAGVRLRIDPGARHHVHAARPLGRG